MIAVLISCASYEQSNNQEEVSVLTFIQESGLELLNPQRTHTDEVLSIAYDPRGDFLASGSKDTTVKIWDIKSNKVVRSLFGHRSAISKVIYSLDSKYLASISNDGMIIVWDLSNKGVMLSQFNSRIDSSRQQDKHRMFYTIAFHPTQTKLASAGSDGYIRIWDVESAKLIQEINNWGQAVHTIAFSPDGIYLASGGIDTVVRLWNIQDIVSDSGNTTKKRQSIQGYRNHYGDINDVSFSPDGQYLASASDDCTIVVYSIPILLSARNHIEGKKASYVLKGHAANIYAISFSADSRYITSSSADERIKVWDVKNARLQSTIEDGNDRIWTVAFNIKLHQIASAGTDTNIKLWSFDGTLIIILQERRELASIYDNTMFTLFQLEQELAVVPHFVLAKWREYKQGKTIVYIQNKQQRHSL